MHNSHFQRFFAQDAVKMKVVRRNYYGIIFGKLINFRSDSNRKRSQVDYVYFVFGMPVTAKNMRFVKPLIIILCYIRFCESVFKFCMHICSLRAVKNIKNTLFFYKIKQYLYYNIIKNKSQGG